MNKSIVLFAFVIGFSTPQIVSASEPAAIRDNVVLQWNSAALQAIRNTGFAPMRAARGFAILHTCMYDAWALYDDVAVGVHWGSLLRQPKSERTEKNIERAVSFAAHLALVDLFPTQRAVLFDPLMKTLGFDAADTSVHAYVGRQACDNVLEFRHGDGANQIGDENGGARTRTTPATFRSTRRMCSRIRTDGNRFDLPMDRFRCLEPPIGGSSLRSRSENRIGFDLIRRRSLVLPNM